MEFNAPQYFDFTECDKLNDSKEIQMSEKYFDFDHENVNHSVRSMSSEVNENNKSPTKKMKETPRRSHLRKVVENTVDEVLNSPIQDVPLPSIIVNSFSSSGSINRKKMMNRRSVSETREYSMPPRVSKKNSDNDMNESLRRPLCRLSTPVHKESPAFDASSPVGSKSPKKSSETSNSITPQFSRWRNIIKWDTPELLKSARRSKTNPNMHSAPPIGDTCVAVQQLTYGDDIMLKSASKSYSRALKENRERGGERALNSARIPNVVTATSGPLKAVGSVTVPSNKIPFSNVKNRGLISASKKSRPTGDQGKNSDGLGVGIVSRKKLVRQNSTTSSNGKMADNRFIVKLNDLVLEDLDIERQTDDSDVHKFISKERRRRSNSCDSSKKFTNVGLGLSTKVKPFSFVDRDLERDRKKKMEARAREHSDRGGGGGGSNLSRKSRIMSSSKESLYSNTSSVMNSTSASCHDHSSISNGGCDFRSRRAAPVPLLHGGGNARKQWNKSVNKPIDIAVRLPPHSTKVEPFSFDQRDAGIDIKRQERLNRVLEQEKKMREFKAAPNRKFESQRRHLPPVTVQAATKLEPFNFEIDKRLNERHEKWVNDMKAQMEERRQAASSFRANVDPVVLHKEPFVPEKMSGVEGGRKPLTVVNFELNTDRRAVERAELDAVRKQRDTEVEMAKRQTEEIRQQEEERMYKEMRKQTVHKAQGVKTYCPIDVQKGLKPATIAQTPKFSKLHCEKKKSLRRVGQ